MISTEQYSPVANPPTFVTIHRRNHKQRLYTSISIVSLLITALIAAIRISNRYKHKANDPFYNSNSNPNASSNDDPNNFTNNDNSPILSFVHVGFIGNSILYFNDSPRTFSNLVSLSQRPHPIVQDSCLHGGGSLSSILEVGNGMEVKWHTPNAMRPDGSYDIGWPTVQSLLKNNTWDFVVMNDYTQNPARLETREHTIEVLQGVYSHLLSEHTIPVLLMTHAYRKPVKDSDDLFPMQYFTSKLCHGYQAYAMALNTALKQKITRIAYFGKAFELIYHEDFHMWEKLFYIDDLHPSAHGTLLQDCVLYYTIFQEDPPAFERQDDVMFLWRDARRMYPPEDNIEVVYPTVDEAMYLRSVAGRVWKASEEQGEGFC